MDTTLAIIDAREKGAVPVSIGTSLALESGAGVYPERPVSPAPFTTVKEVWINLRTLVRNLNGCIATDWKDRILPEHLQIAVREELDIIPAAVERGSNGRCKVVYYACDHSRLAKRFPHASLRTPTTDKQILQHMVEENALKLLLGEYGSHDVRVFDTEITGSYPSAFIMTHQPIDLLARYAFQRLELLESHTGAIKGPAAWHSKLTNGKELHNVPFNRFTLQVFGDNGNMFSPKGISVRRSLLEMALRDKWTNVSSLERIRSSAQKIDKKEHREELLQLM